MYRCINKIGKVRVMADGKIVSQGDIIFYQSSRVNLILQYLGCVYSSLGTKVIGRP